MTRGEAIKILRREIECLSHTKCEDCILEVTCDPIKTTPYDSEYIEVYEMAIKALEKNESAEEWYKLLCEKWDSAENKGDLISRQAVLEQINCWIEGGEYRYTNATDYLTKRISKLPSVENKGEWKHDGSRWKNRFICSACGYKLFDAPTNYCPNCGARMKGGE